MESVMYLPLLVLFVMIYGVIGQNYGGGYQNQRFVPMFMSRTMQRPPMFVPNTAPQFARTNVQFSPPTAPPAGQIVYSTPWVAVRNPWTNQVFNPSVMPNGMQRQRLLHTQSFVQNALVRPAVRHQPTFPQNARFMQTPMIRTAPAPFRRFAQAPGFHSVNKKKKHRISVMSDPLVDIRPFPAQSHHHMKKKTRMRNVAKAKPFDSLLSGTSMRQNKG